ncbi:MAG: hypothetical protein ACPGEG_08985 [Salibacteraceae bacterium]
MRTILLGFVFTILLITSCTKENPLDPESDNTYTIEGVMYDQDGVSPLKNYPLNIVADKGQTIGGGSDYDYPDQTTTDDNGYFKMTYRGNSSYSSLWIGQPSSVTPVYGPFLTGIPANSSIVRNICIVPKSLMKVQLIVNKQLNLTDSILVSNLDARAINDSLYKYNMISASGYIYIYIYTPAKSLKDNTWIVPLKWGTDYYGASWSIRWGLGQNQFEKALALGRSQSSNSTEYAVIPFNVLSFPDTTKVTININ